MSRFRQMAMIYVLFVLGAMPVLSVLGVMALQQKWHAFAAFAGVVVVIFAFFFGLAGFVVWGREPDPRASEELPDGAVFVLAGLLASGFAGLASLLAVPALFMRWGRDERARG